MLIKACELLDDENEDLNIFIVARLCQNKDHNETLENKDQAGENYHKTKSFLESQGTLLKIFLIALIGIDNGMWSDEWQKPIDSW